MAPEELGTIAQRLRDSWRLRVDGSAHDGEHAYVLPVRTDDDAAAILKISKPDRESGHEHVVLRRWGGNGAVRLLRADPHQQAVLLDRLGPSNVESRPDAEACGIVAGLYRRLHVPAMPQLRSLTSVVEEQTAELDDLPRGAPIPHRLVEQAAALSRELTAEAAGPSVVLHGDLHYRNVLASDTAAWLAISPRPLNGDPHYELAPMLWHRWEELAGNIRDGLRYRFSLLVDAADLDEDRARAWTLIRVIHAAIHQLRRDGGSATTALTRYVAIAKAVQD